MNKTAAAIVSLSLFAAALPALADESSSSSSSSAASSSSMSSMTSSSSSTSSSSVSSSSSSSKLSRSCDGRLGIVRAACLRQQITARMAAHMSSVAALVNANTSSSSERPPRPMLQKGLKIMDKMSHRLLRPTQKNHVWSSRSSSSSSSANSSASSASTTSSASSAS